MSTTDDSDFDFDFDFDHDLARLAPAVDRAAARSAWSTEARRRSQRRRRRRVMATTIVVLAASTATWLVVANRSAERSTGPISPPLTTATASTTATSATTTDRPDTSAPSTSPEPSSPTASPTTTTDLGVVEVATVLRTVEPVRTVIYSFGIGNGSNELGQEDCRECDPVVPWAPVELPTGELVILDSLNRRWVVVSDGAVRVSDAAMIGSMGQPIVDEAGRIYTIRGRDLSTDPPGSTLHVWDVVDLSAPTQSFPAPEFRPFVRLDLGADGGVTANGEVVPDTETLRDATIERPSLVWNTLGQTSASIDVTWRGSTRHWRFPFGWFIGGVGQSSGQPDGSVLVTAQPPGSEQRLLVRLDPDGSATAIPDNAGSGWNGSRTVWPRGVLSFSFTDSSIDVVRLEFPTAATEAADSRPFPSGPGPVFWMARTCDGECTVGLPDGLPDLVVYADGRVMAATMPDGRSVAAVAGTISDDGLRELRALLASTGLSAGTTSGPIPLPNGEIMTEPITTWFSARLVDGPVTQRVESLHPDVEETTEPRRTWAELAALVDEIWHRTVDGDPPTSDRWVAVASSEVSSFGDVAWEPFGNGLHCTIVTDPDLALTTENDTTWSLPADVTSLRPALPHETDCTAVASWDTLRSASGA